MELESEIKSRFRNPHHKSLVNLIYTYNHMTGCLHQLLSANQLTMQQFNILRILRGAHPETVTHGEIKERMLDKNSDITRIVDRLIKENYVTRANCEQDRRKVNIKITQKGLDKLSALDKEKESIDSIMSGLTTEEATQLNILLDKARSGKPQLFCKK